jgi:hypothetical protein
VNVALTKQDVLKKEFASASKARKLKKSISPPAPRKKAITKRTKKAVSDSSDESSSEDVANEIPIYDRLAILDRPA